MNKVLVPTDFSTNATHALDYAMDLFKCHRTRFYLLHAFADEVYDRFKGRNQRFDEQREAAEKNSDVLLGQLMDTCQKKHANPKHEFESVSSFDALVEAVNDTVNEHNIDLTIMGTQGQTSDKHVTFGSHTVQVFKYVQCPVLAIPEDYTYHHPKKILFPTDYQIPYKRRELKLLNGLAASYKSQVDCLYISDFDELSQRQLDNRRFLAESLTDAFLDHKRIPVAHKADAIQTCIDQWEIDLLVMVNSRHSLLEDMLYRSTVDEIGLQIKIPFLVLQNLPR